MSAQLSGTTPLLHQCVCFQIRCLFFLITKVVLSSCLYLRKHSSLHFPRAPREQSRLVVAHGGWGREALAGGVCPADRTWRSQGHAPLAPAGRLDWLRLAGAHWPHASSHFTCLSGAGLSVFFGLDAGFASAAGMAQRRAGPSLGLVSPSAQFQFVLPGDGSLA